jgi:hypothetical protein
MEDSFDFECVLAQIDKESESYKNAPDVADIPSSSSDVKFTLGRFKCMYIYVYIYTYIYIYVYIHIYIICMYKMSLLTQHPHQISNSL